MVKLNGDAGTFLLFLFFSLSVLFFLAFFLSGV